MFEEEGKGGSSLDVVGYVRVSGDEQAKKGISLDTQREKLELYARFKGLNLVRIVADEGWSAKDLKRPGVVELLRMMDEKEIGGVLIYKLDRLTRSLKDWSFLIDAYFGDKTGIKLFSVGDDINTQSAAGRLVLNLLMSVAQWERETNAERTTDNLATHKAKGRRAGKLLYGYRIDPDGPLSTRGHPVGLIPDPAEQATIRLMEELDARGMSLRAICHHLEELGIETKEGSRIWSPSSIRNILTRSKAGGQIIIQNTAG